MSKIYDMPRQSGKTTYLLRRSHATGIPVLVWDEDMAMQLAEYAHRHNLYRARVLGPDDLKQPRSNDRMFVDELPLVFKALTGVEIVESVFTSDEVKTREYF